MRRVKPLAERLFARVDKTPGCWEWRGAIGRYGYGFIGAGRRGEGTVLVHRAAYEHLVGPIPAGMDLDHLCRNRACCNPDHLEPVTRTVNNLRGVRSNPDVPRPNWRDHLPERASA